MPTPATTDAELDAILGDVLAQMALRTPEQVAADVAEVDRQDARMARPLRDRAIEAAIRLDPVAARAVFAEQRRVACIDDLAPADRAYLKKMRQLVEDHPLTLPLADVLTLRGSGIAWLETYICEELWAWAWCADDLEVPLAVYAKGQPPVVLAAIEAARPWPEGWIPACARSRTPQ